MKYIRIVCIIYFCMLTYVNNFSFAQTSLVDENYCTTSPVCGTTPPKYLLLLDFVREINNSIKTIGTQGDYVGKYVSPNRFQGQKFVPPQKSLLGKLVQNVQQKILFGVATTAIFTTPVEFAGINDFFGSIVLLFKNEVFLRDVKITNQLLSQVTDKRYELGLGGGWYDVINEPNRAYINSIIDTYIKKGLLLEGSYVREGTMYNNITSLLVKVLSAAKEILYSGSTHQLTTLSRGGSDGVVLIFNPQTILHIQKDYACAEGLFNVCSSTFKKFSNAMDGFWDDSINSWKRSKKVFVSAFDKLQQIFVSGEQSESLKTREAELLTSLYGTTQLSDKKISAGFDVDGDDLTDIANNVTGLVNRFVHTTQTAFSALQTLNNLKKSSNFSSSKKISMVNQKIFSDMLKPYMQEVLDNQQKDVSLIVLAEVSDITSMFSSLVEKISIIREKILGGKNIEGSLIKNLGEACSLQCGRGGWCYY